MNTFAEVVEKVSEFSTPELEEIKLIVNRQLSERRTEEIAKALTEVKKSSGTFTYYTNGEDLIASLHED